MPSFEEDRTHMGAWIIISAPLILGYDVTNPSKTEKIWEIVANTEAIAINQVNEIALLSSQQHLL